MRSVKPIKSPTRLMSLGLLLSASCLEMGQRRQLRKCTLGRIRFFDTSCCRAATRIRPYSAIGLILLSERVDISIAQGQQSPASPYLAHEKVAI